MTVEPPRTIRRGVARRDALALDQALVFERHRRHARIGVVVEHLEVVVDLETQAEMREHPLDRVAPADQHGRASRSMITCCAACST